MPILIEESISLKIIKAQKQFKVIFGLVEKLAVSDLMRGKINEVINKLKSLNGS